MANDVVNTAAKAATLNMVYQVTSEADGIAVIAVVAMIAVVAVTSR